MTHSTIAFRPPTRPLPLRLAPIACTLAGLGLLSAAMACAAEGQAAGAPPTVAELQARLAQVQAENAQLRQALAGQNIPAPAAPPPPQTPAVAAAPAEEEPQALGDVTVRGRKKIETLKDVPLSTSSRRPAGGRMRAPTAARDLPCWPTA